MDIAPQQHPPVEFERDPASYRHWQVSYDGAIARLRMCVDPDGGLRPGYELKLNSYDLGVDIELADVVRRLRFEHPEVRVVLLSSGTDNVFCAGANIHMLGQSTHAWKVNFCKFTNETRCEIEDATLFSAQTYLAACNGTCAGGGYELALACKEIYLQDDGNSPSASPRSRCSACSPAPAASPASSTSAASGATAPTCSRPPPRAFAASGPRSGASSTPSTRAASSIKRS
jgi:benzoyl-CoA-dihydrodiol lyase